MPAAGDLLTVGSGLDAAWAPPADWLKDINPMLAPSAVIQGIWVPTAYASQVGNGWLGNSSDAQNDSIAWDIGLSAGTWTLSVLTLTAATSAIQTWTIDGATVGTFDAFTSAAVFNVVRNFTGLVVAESGKHRLAVKAASRNAANTTDWAVSLTAIGLRRTA